jgi:hypothetical protein
VTWRKVSSADDRFPNKDWFRCLRRVGSVVVITDCGNDCCVGPSERKISPHAAAEWAPLGVHLVRRLAYGLQMQMQVLEDVVKRAFSWGIVRTDYLASEQH